MTLSRLIALVTATALTIGGGVVLLDDLQPWATETGGRSTLVAIADDAQTRSLLWSQPIDVALAEAVEAAHTRDGHSVPVTVSGNTARWEAADGSACFELTLLDAGDTRIIEEC